LRAPSRLDESGSQVFVVDHDRLLVELLLDLEGEALDEFVVLDLVGGLDEVDALLDELAALSFVTAGSHGLSVAAEGLGEGGFDRNAEAVDDGKRRRDIVDRGGNHDHVGMIHLASPGGGVPWSRTGLNWVPHPTRTV